jgi:hypothetical protein
MRFFNALGNSVSLFRVMIFLKGFDEVGLLKKSFENEVGKKYKEFQDATFFLNRSKMR